MIDNVTTSTTKGRNRYRRPDGWASVFSRMCCCVGIGAGALFFSACEAQKHTRSIQHVVEFAPHWTRTDGGASTTPAIEFTATVIFDNCASSCETVVMSKCLLNPTGKRIDISGSATLEYRTSNSSDCDTACRVVKTRCPPITLAPGQYEIVYPTGSGLHWKSIEVN